jgi:molybdopterin-binding protein
MQEWLGGGCNNIRSSTTQIISGPGNNLINCQINGALLSSSLTQSSITHIY